MCCSARQSICRIGAARRGLPMAQRHRAARILQTTAAMLMNGTIKAKMAGIE